MSFIIPQSTAVVVVFKAFLASDHVSEATGKTIAITISKAGGAFGNPNAGATNATEISSGWYKVTLDTTDTGTLGHLAIRGAVASIDDIGIVYQVVKATNGGLTALPDAVADAAGGLPISDAGGLDLDAKIGALTYGTANRVNAQVYGMEANTLTATAINADAITNAKIADNAIAAENIASDAIAAAKIATGAITAAKFAAGAIDAAAIANGAIDAATFAADVDAEILSYIVDDATRIDASALNTAAVTSIPAILVDTGTTLDGAIATIDGIVDAILVDTGTTLDAAIADLPTNAELTTALAAADDAVLAAIAALNNLSASGLLGTSLADTYAANGAQPTLQQAIMGIHQHLMAFSIASTSRTVKKLNGSDTAFVETLDDDTAPTALTRA